MKNKRTYQGVNKSKGSIGNKAYLCMPKKHSPNTGEKLLLHDGKKIPFVEIREELIMSNGFAESKMYYKHKGKWKLLVHRKV